MDDIRSDPDFQDFERRVQSELVPKLQDSAMTMSLVPSGQVDVKFAVELGLSIMLDKPIIALVQPGTKVPDHLVRVADAIVEYDPKNLAAAAPAIKAAMDRVAPKEQS